MSYSIKFRIRDGEIAATEVTGQLPEGQFELNGHEDAGYISISVTRRDAEGRYAAGASHGHPTGEARAAAYPRFLIDIPE